MSEPWFDPNALIIVVGCGGGLLGILGGIAGGVLLPLGKGKAFVLGAMRMFIALGVVSLLVGLVALVVGQPYGIWMPFCGAGVSYVSVCGIMIPVMQFLYRQVEQRRMEAESNRTS